MHHVNGSKATKLCSNMTPPHNGYINVISLLATPNFHVQYVAPYYYLIIRKC